MSSNSQRIKWIDYARVVAIVCVVLCHATERIYRLTLDGIAGLSLQSRIFCFLCFTVGRLGVPFFLMITGYLLLQKEYNDVQTKTFWKTKCIHLLICTMLWFSIYDVFLATFKHETISVKTILFDIILLHSVNLSHAWYLPMILGTYILIPFVATSVKRYDYKLLLPPIIIYSCYLFGFPLIYAIILCLNPETTLSNQLYVGFSGGIYGVYIIYGYLISKGALKRISSIIITIASLLCFIASIALQLWSYKNGTAYNIWYDNLLVLIASLGFFELFSRIQKPKLYPIIKIVAAYAFPIYLTHNLVRSVTGKIINVLPINKPFQTICLWVVCLACSMPISFMISKVPKIGPYLLYMKAPFGHH